MRHTLDLSITLTPPPAETPGQIIASTALRCDALGLSHTGNLLSDPLTQQERNDLHWYLEEYWKWPFYQFAERGKQVEDLLIDVGKRLYQAVFSNPIVTGIVQAWRLQPGVTRQVSILSDIPYVLSLPWELLHDEQGFLVMHTRNPISIIRRLPQGQLPELSTPFEPPLRNLLATARPEGTGFIDPRGVAKELLDEMEEQIRAGTVTLEFLRPPTLHTLRKRLADTARPAHILHFDGHGIFEDEVEEQDGLCKLKGTKGKLAFENEEGKLDLVDADGLAHALLDSGVRLVVLDACQCAMGSEDDAFSSVATRLIQGAWMP
jgi:CHAT domain